VAHSDDPKPTAPKLVGTVLDGRYRVTRQIGKGGMGFVYEAEHVDLGRRVAIKVLKPDYAHDARFQRRFMREARAASLIAHENVVKIVDFGTGRQGPAYFVMEYLDGSDLGQLLAGARKLPWWRARAILLQIAAALGAAHEHGIVHRDVKLANCFLVRRTAGEPDLVKVLDFGVAKATADMLDSRRLTAADELIGTVSYMAPELTQGKPADRRSDVYALGILAYRLVSGRVPFDDPDMFKVMAYHLNVAPVPPRELTPELSVAAEQVILRAIAKRPEARFQSMADFARALAAVGEGPRTGGTPVDVDEEDITAIRPDPHAASPFPRPSANTPPKAEPTQRLPPTSDSITLAQTVAEDRVAPRVPKQTTLRLEPLAGPPPPEGSTEILGDIAGETERSPPVTDIPPQHSHSASHPSWPVTRAAHARGHSPSTGAVVIAVVLAALSVLACGALLAWYFSG
jgi:serine/threonine-protein kinase